MENSLKKISYVGKKVFVGIDVHQRTYSVVAVLEGTILKLATLLEAGRLKGIRIPSLQEEQKRMLTRIRQQLVEDRSAIKNKIRMKCHDYGAD